MSNQNKDIKIITTDDGSHSLFVPSLNETYHSFHGALQESSHVFIKHGLHYLLEKHSQPEVSILEVGFGTGLNALLTAIEAEKQGIKVNYKTIEPFPLENQVIDALNYEGQVGANHVNGLLAKMHNANWEIPVPITDHFVLAKYNTTLQNTHFPDQYFDLVYFDAFAPSKQPELWHIDVLKKVADTMKSEAIFVTYCAKGQLKRDLKSLGMHVETLAGPPGKKEMVRGTRS